MTEHEERQLDAALRERLRQAIEGSAASPGTINDTLLEAARNAGSAIRARSIQRRRWPALAASFVLGAMLTGATVHWFPRNPEFDPPLVVPVSPAMRDGASQSQSLAVESVAPQVWYEYIERLIYTGRLEEAERHLRRFNELHPGFQPEP